MAKINLIYSIALISVNIMQNSILIISKHFFQLASSVLCSWFQFAFIFALGVGMCI